MQNPTTSKMATGTKRSAASIIVDPDTLQQLEDAKRPRITLDADKKYKCIKSIVTMYEKLIAYWFPQGIHGETMGMEEDGGQKVSMHEALRSITIGNHITSIVFTLHNTMRQETKGVQTNMTTKTLETSFKIHYRGKDLSIDNKTARNMWKTITKENELVYKLFPDGDSQNWYGTMGPYLDMFSSYALRVNELRLGHNNMPIAKENGKHKSFPVTKYGLSGAHHVLLEGTSFPPERRSSIVQSLGPMTAWLCMLRSDGIYRKKYAAAVKRAFSHVPCIDDLIEITKNIKQASEVSAVTTILAEILMVTTARQATRMYFPMAIFAAVWRDSKDTVALCNFFSSTGAGGWYVYKRAAMAGKYFTVCGKMEEEQASQIVFHGIFGTFKEDLGVLAAITDCARWFTREELGGCFCKQGSSEVVTRFKLPIVKYYSKMSCANQTGLLSGVYNQVVTVPCFSGHRIHMFDADFFNHIEKRRIIGTTGKTMTQIMGILTTILEELHDKVRKENGKMEMGTTSWHEMSSLEIGTPGEQIEIVIKGTGEKFLGKRD